MKKLPRKQKILLLDIFRRDILRLQLPQLHFRAYNRIVQIGWMLENNREIVKSLIIKRFLCYKTEVTLVNKFTTIRLTNEIIEILRDRDTLKCQVIANKGKLKTLK